MECIPMAVQVKDGNDSLGVCVEHTFPGLCPWESILLGSGANVFHNKMVVHQSYERY